MGAHVGEQADRHERDENEQEVDREPDLDITGKGVVYESP
jgi:hypothetical protein